MAKRFSVEAVFKAIDKITAPVKRMQNQIGRMARNTERGLRRLDRSLDRVSSGFKKVGVAAVAAMAVTGVAMGDVIKTGAEFEQTLVNAATKFSGEVRKGTEEFQRLEDAARQAGRTTEFTASASAAALNELAKAGLDVEQSIGALPGVIDLATVAEVELAEATEIAVGTLGAFNLRVKDSAQLTRNLNRVNDVLAKTTTTSNTTMQTLIDTIKDSGPVAKMAGADIETFAAMTGTLGNASIDASRAGTALKNIFTRLAAPTSVNIKLMRRMGISTKDANGNLRDVIDILGDFEKALDGIGTAERTAILSEVFGMRAVAGTEVLLSKGAKGLKEYREQLRNATGASSLMATVMRSTLMGSFKELNSSIESVKISAFKLAEGPINDVVKQMTKWVRVNEKFIATKIAKFLKAIFENPDKILFWAKAIGVAVAAIGSLIIALKLFIGVMTAVNLAMAMNPVVLTIMGIVAALAALTVAIGAIVFWFDEWTGWMRNMSDGGKILLVTLAALVTGPLGALIVVIALLVSHFEILQEAFTEVFTDMFITIDEWAVGIKQAFKDVMAFFANSFDKLKIKALEAEAIFTFDDTKLARIADDIDKLESEIDARTASRERERQIVNPEQAISRQINETNTTSRTEVTIKDETGKAEITGPKVTGLQLQQSGGF